MANVVIRAAHRDDCRQICHVLRASIRQLCDADHADDPIILAGWLANKNAETVAIWLEDTALLTLIALIDGKICGVGQMRENGEITLNYVLPQFRFMGVCKSIMLALEERARYAGLSRCHLISTKTARSFYADRGYAEIKDTREQGSIGIKYAREQRRIGIYMGKDL